MRSLRKRLLFHALFLSLSLAMGMIGAELIVRVRAESSLQGTLNSFSDSPIPASTEREDLPLIADPVLGFRYNPALDEISSLGLRNPEIEVEKTAGKKRVVILGDSVTVLTNNEPNTPEGLIAQLRDLIGDRGEVVNGAVSGYTIYQQRMILEQELLRFSPDVVVVQHTLNDNQKFLHKFADSGRLLVTEEAQRAYAAEGKGLLYSLSQRSYVALRLRMALLGQGKSEEKYVWDRYPGFPHSWQDESWEFAAEQLTAIRDMSESVGARVVVLSVPFGPQFEEPLLSEEREYVTKPQRKMAEVCAELNIPLVDLFPHFESQGGEEIFYDLVHMIPKGHRIAAEQLVRTLDDFGWLESSPQSNEPVSPKPAG